MANNESIEKYESVKMFIRAVDLSDLQDIFEWRNDALSRFMSISSGTVSLIDHIDWYQRSLKNPFRKIFIGLTKDKKVGVVRFDLDVDSNESQVSINLNPHLRGKGYSFTLLSRSINLYLQDQEATLRAIIKKENCGSLKIFGKCNFHIESETEFFYYLTRE